MLSKLVEGSLVQHTIVIILALFQCVCVVVKFKYPNRTFTNGKVEVLKGKVTVLKSVVEWGITSTSDHAASYTTSRFLITEQIVAMLHTGANAKWVNCVLSYIPISRMLVKTISWEKRWGIQWHLPSSHKNKEKLGAIKNTAYMEGLFLFIFWEKLFMLVLDSTP